MWVRLFVFSPAGNKFSALGHQDPINAVQCQAEDVSAIGSRIFKFTGTKPLEKSASQSTISSSSSENPGSGTGGESSSDAGEKLS